MQGEWKGAAAASASVVVVVSIERRRRGKRREEGRKLTHDKRREEKRREEREETDICSFFGRIAAVLLRATVYYVRYIRIHTQKGVSTRFEREKNDDDDYYQD